MILFGLAPPASVAFGLLPDKHSFRIQCCSYSVNLRVRAQCQPANLLRRGFSPFGPGAVAKLAFPLASLSPVKHFLSGIELRCGVPRSTRGNSLCHYHGVQ